MTAKTLTILGSAMALLLGACGSDGPAEPKAAAVPATLPPGEYELTATLKSLASTDKTPLTIDAKPGDTMTVRGCVDADGLPDPQFLAAKGDVCQLQDPYVRGGRMNFTLDCTRKGQGKVMSSVSGTYTADGFTGTLSASSLFAGPGDYRLVEDFTARKVADQCSAEAAGKAA